MYRGESVDTAEMLKLSEALGRYLPKQPEPMAFDPDEGVDPHQKLIDMVDRWIDAKEAEEAVREATEVEALRAENAELKAAIERLSGAPKLLPAPEAKPIDGEVLPPKPVPPQPVSSEEAERRRQRVANDRSVEHKVMGNQRRDEPWRPLVGGGSTDFFWNGTGGRSW